MNLINKGGKCLETCINSRPCLLWRLVYNRHLEDGRSNLFYLASSLVVYQRVPFLFNIVWSNPVWIPAIHLAKPVLSIYNSYEPCVHPLVRKQCAHRGRREGGNDRLENMQMHTNNNNST